MRLNFLRKSLRPYHGKIYIVLLFIFLQAAYISTLTFSFKFIVDALLKNDKNLLLSLLSALCLGIVIIIAISISRDYIYTKFVEDLGRDMRSKMFDHLGNLSIDFYSRTSAEDILSHFSNDLRATQSALLSIPSGLVFPIFSLFTNIIALSILNWKLSIFAILICPLIFIGPHKLSKKLIIAQQEKVENEVKLTTITLESVSMQNIIKAFRLFSYVKKKFDFISTQLAKKAFPVSFIHALIERWGQFFPLVLQLLILLVGVYVTFEKYINIGTLIAFQSISGTLIYSLMGITYSFSNVLQGIGSTQRLENFINEPEIIIGKNKLLSSFHKISFKDVSFGYNPSRLILKNITFEINRYQSIAFVGASGSGKSSILNLLAGFYEPTKGKILIDEDDFRDVSKDSLRKLMGFVFQEPLLFKTSIKENILLGKLDATQEEVENAAKAAEIHDAILQTPNNYDELIGERGGRLSGGQKQRLSIARAMIAKPPILVLDEITSSLDAATEYAINNTVKRLSKNCTTISVTHRLDSIKNVDYIFVLNHGEICERGTHTDLIKRNGYYKSLWDKQHGFVIDVDSHEVDITVDRLKLIPLFQDIPSEIIKNILPLFKSVSYEKKHTIISEGEMGDMFYIIVRGKIEISKSINKKQTIVAVLEDGDYFGEIALLKKIARTAAVRTLSPCLLLTLHHHDFISLLENNPQLLEKIEKIILSRS